MHSTENKNSRSIILLTPRERARRQSRVTMWNEFYAMIWVGKWKLKCLRDWRISKKNFWQFASVDQFFHSFSVFSQTRRRRPERKELSEPDPSPATLLHFPSTLWKVPSRNLRLNVIFKYFLPSSRRLRLSFRPRPSGEVNRHWVRNLTVSMEYSALGEAIDLEWRCLCCLHEEVFGL